MRLLVIAAVPAEVRAVGLALRTPLLSLPEGEVRWFARLPKPEVGVLRTGPGPEAASRAVGEALASHDVGGVLNVGWAGGLHSGLGLGSLVVARRFLDARGGEALDADDGVLGAWVRQVTLPLGARVADLVTVPGFVAGVGDKSDLHRRLGAWACEMEGWEVARACRARGVPVAALRTVSDPADVELPSALAGGTAGGGRAGLRTALRARVVRGAFEMAGQASLVPLVRALRRLLHTLPPDVG